jgi:hypothetical protein
MHLCGCNVLIKLVCAGHAHARACVCVCVCVALMSVRGCTQPSSSVWGWPQHGIILDITRFPKRRTLPIKCNFDPVIRYRDCFFCYSSMLFIHIGYMKSNGGHVLSN